MAGIAFHEVLRRRVLAPAGMESAKAAPASIAEYGVGGVRCSLQAPRSAAAAGVGCGAAAAAADLAQWQEWLGGLLPSRVPPPVSPR